MQILFISDEEQEKEIRQKSIHEEVAVIFANKFINGQDYKKYDALFILTDINNFIDFRYSERQPVYINSVVNTLATLQKPANISRMNGWPGFLQRDVWEVATQNTEETQQIFSRIGWRIKLLPDEPGFVAARVLSMIINEAFFALEDKVSTTDEIDVAMKLGTNYPYGPFEWAEKIGTKNILDLLNKLAEKDRRYLPSTALEQYQFKQK